jgi:hypothetical protein
VLLVFVASPYAFKHVLPSSPTIGIFEKENRLVMLARPRGMGWEHGNTSFARNTTYYCTI